MQVVGRPSTKLSIYLDENYIAIHLDQVSVIKKTSKDKTTESEIAWRIKKGNANEAQKLAVFLDMAAGIAATLDYTITSKADFERVRLIPYPDKVKKQDSILIADVTGEIMVMYPGKWVE